MMETGRIMLLSAEDREDVVELWRVCFEKYWPDCPMPVDILAGSTICCWTARLLEYLGSVDNEWLFLWVDDNFLMMPVLMRGIERALGFFRSQPRLAVFHLINPSHPVNLKPIEGFPYGYFEGLGSAMHPVPSFWRRRALLDISEALMPRLTPEQDSGWAGFYNWELSGGPTLVREGWTGARTMKHSPPLLAIANAVQQGKWSAHAVEMEQNGEFVLSQERGFYELGENWASDEWRAAGPPRRTT